MFLGRKEELNLLEKEYRNDNSFCCVYGTRRIGKTSLLQEFTKNKKNIFFQAKEVSNYDNLRSFSETINNELNVNIEYVYSSWEQAFNAAISYFGNNKGIIVIDEYPYLIKSYPGISSVIQDIWDNMLSKKKIMLILSGSNLSFMQKELNDKQSPLYKRISMKLRINKLCFSEAKLFVKGCSINDQAKYLSLFGPYPYYLSMINKKISFEENIKSLLFSKTSILLDAPKLTISNATREQSFYNSILYCVSGKKKSLTEISRDMKEDSTKINKYLSLLIDSEIIQKNEMFNSKRKTYYTIQDPVLDFYYKFILKNKEKIEAGLGDAVYERLKESIDLYISKKFEDISILYMEELNKENKLKGLFYPIQNLIIDNSELNRSIEIDGISKDDDALLVIECKFTNKKRNINDYMKLKENVSIKMFKNIKKYYFYIISKNGFEKSLLNNKEDNLTLIDLNVMFK